MTKIVGTLTIMFFLLFLANLVVQLATFVRLVKFLTFKKWIRTVMYFLLIPFTLLYINDVFSLLYSTWGAPAFNMTRPSQESNVKNGNNYSYFCLYDWRDVKKTHYEKLKVWLDYSLSLSRVSRLFWTITLFTGFIYLQCR